MLPVRFFKPTSALFNWDPFRELDQVVQLLSGSDGERSGGAQCTLQVDVKEEDGQYLIQADMPGFGKDAVDVTFQDGLLTIIGQVESDTQRQDENFHVRERHVGKVSRSVRLPDEVDSENIQAAMADGVLTVTVPKAPTVQPRKITVSGD